MRLHRCRQFIFTLTFVALPWFTVHAAENPVQPTPVVAPSSKTPVATENPVQPTPVVAPPSKTPVRDYKLLVEPLSAEWEAHLLPPMMQNLLRVAPYTLMRTDAANALRVVAETPGRLALLRRSSALAAGTPSDLELLEVGPASCMTLVIRKNALWGGYADLNYRSGRPLRVEAVSPSASQDFQRLLNAFPITGDISLEVRPTHIAIQRLVAGDTDLVVLEVPRRGASNQPADVMHFAMERELRLLDLPPALSVISGPLQSGEVIVQKGWLWEQPEIYHGLCDPFVLAMPAKGADQLVYTLYSAVTQTPTPKPQQPGLLDQISDAAHRLLVAMGILSP